ncbi:MAG: winged helix-turn-helix transcriptional regulator [Candidatus Solibacter usitatus]|nr:winged helix-turn-helix transcriptional regulator [Candidatus Solibacter usitatus]
MTLSSTVYKDQHLVFDFHNSSAYVDLREIILTRKEHELMGLLVNNTGEIVPRDVLLERIWGYGRDIRTRTLDVHIRRLRKKLFPYGDSYIETVFGVGYRFSRYRELRRHSNFVPELVAV